MVLVASCLAGKVCPSRPWAFPFADPTTTHIIGGAKPSEQKQQAQQEGTPPPPPEAPRPKEEAPRPKEEAAEEPAPKSRDKSESNSNSKESTEGVSGGGGEKKGGKKGGVPPKEFNLGDFLLDPKTRGVVLAGVVGVVAGVAAMQGPPDVELSWKDFVTLYLEPHKVEKLVVVNKSAVRVVLKAPPGSGSTSTQGQLVLTIGSVDNFERRLEYAC